jgi:predicted nucleic acid-binding protein
MSLVLVDTNLLIYAHDPSDTFKQDRAIETLRRLRATGEGRLSAQCLGEFYAAATRGKRPLLTAARASQQVQNLALSWVVFNITPLITIEAVRGARTYKLPYWDAQLWATARLNQVPGIFTEDFSPGEVLDGVRFVNPFSSSFNIDDW